MERLARTEEEKIMGNIVFIAIEWADMATGRILSPQEAGERLAHGMMEATLLFLGIMVITLVGGLLFGLYQEWKWKKGR